jgi:hypothetical protein
VAANDMLVNEVKPLGGTPVINSFKDSSNYGFEKL